MIDASMSLGNRMYSNSEYDALTGYVTGIYTNDWTDKSGTHWRTQVTIINLGRAATFPVGDPDALLAQPLPSDGKRRSMPDAATQARSAYAAQRQALLQVEIVEYLKAHGPSSIERLRVALAHNRDYVARHLRKAECELYCRLPQDRKSDLWGLIGVHDKEAA